MRILYLAPHPFYQNRGSPIATRLLLSVLDRRGVEVDLVTYAEGEDVPFANVTHTRVPDVPFLRGIRPGFSLKKLAADALMLVVALRLLLRKRYDVIHAAEEMAFLALLLKPLFKTPYVYDMDSSLAQQLVEQMPWLRPLSGLFTWCERLVVRGAAITLVICDALAEVAVSHGARNVVVLYDVPLPVPQSSAPVEDLGAVCGGGPVVMYVGNLQPYQGIDLLLESFARVDGRAGRPHLVVIGGQPEDVEAYRRRAEALGLGGRAHFLGPRPVEQLARYLAQADVLVSPRITGTNTPMKLYSYLESGKPVLATHLRTHTQVLDERVALLAPPHPEAFAEGLVRLLRDAALRERLGQAGRALVASKYNHRTYEATVDDLLERLAAVVGPGESLAANSQS